MFQAWIYACAKIITISLVGLNDNMDMLTRLIYIIITLFQISANPEHRTPHVRTLMAK